MTEVQKSMALFSGSVNPELADEIAKELGVSLGNVKLEKFANGEIYARYQESVTRAYGEDAPGHLSERQQELMNRFLELGSVQRDLGAMTPEQRAASLRDVRQGMGLDEAALERWKELDVRRDARWELGSRYMAERATLAGGTAGPEQDARLAQLRMRYFPDEAATLAEEEASGFFRFGQARRWGRE